MLPQEYSVIQYGIIKQANKNQGCAR